MQIKVKYHSLAAKPLLQAHPGEWLDLRAAEDVELKAGESKLISLGISVEVPSGYEAIMTPRSSTFKRYGIIQTNSIGIIDETYNGNDDCWFFPAHAMRDIKIEAGTRIAQFRLQKNQGTVEVQEVDSLNNQNRGGLGSTGTK